LKNINVAIIGASGYTGLELIKMVFSHKYFNIKYLANSEGDTKLSKLHKSFENVFECDIQKANPDDVAKECQLAFLALPHKSAMNFAKELLARDVRVVDLSADYRLTKDNYEKFYCAHIDDENLKNAVYGLPELNREYIRNANILANPGCYPTASLLGILPFIDYIDGNIFIDAKSGVSGAGKSCNERTHFVSVNENIFAYSPITHRHSIEIEEKLKSKNSNINITFVPQLLPLTRGMLVNIYATLKSDIEPLEILRNSYKNEKFVRVRENPVDVKSVAGTNFCDLFAMRNGNALFVSSTIDNLLRGASSQAVVNANIMFGLEEYEGIPIISYVP